MKLFLSLALTVFGLLGIIDAGFISYSEFSGQLPPCKPPFACREVLESKWSKVGPIPLAVFGLFFYSIMFTLGILSFMDIRTVTIARAMIGVPTLIMLFGTSGILFSMWLVFIMGVLIKAWCFYCLLSALNCSMIFIVSLGLFRTGQLEVTS